MSTENPINKPIEDLIDSSLLGRPDNWDEPVRLPDIPDSVTTVMVPFDGSPHSESGLAHAVRLAGWTGAKILVLVAYDPPQRMKRRSMLPAESIVAAMEADAKELATETVQLLLDRGCVARGLVVRGDPADAILEAIDHEEIDMVVMGRRGARSLRGVMMGSVSEHIIRHAGVPVLVVA
jgi:nucleotide-binding universal stress UspA family protein